MIYADFEAINRNLTDQVFVEVEELDYYENTGCPLINCARVYWSLFYQHCSLIYKALCINVALITIYIAIYFKRTNKEVFLLPSVHIHHIYGPKC